MNASAVSQVWLFGAKMGPLNDALVHIGFNNPELFRVLLNNRGSRPQAAVVSITRAFEFPAAQRLGQPRRRPAVSRRLPGARLGNDVDAARRAWTRALHRRAVDARERGRADGQGPAAALRESARRHRRPPTRATTSSRAGTTSAPTSTARRSSRPTTHRAVDALVPSSAYLSKDGRSVFVGLPGIKPVMQMRVGWTLATADGTAFQDSASFTPYELTTFNPEAEGFGKLTVDLTPKTEVARASGPVSVEEGRRRLRALWLHRVPRERRVGGLEARPELQGTLRRRPHVPGRARPGHRQRGLHPGVDPRALREGRHRLRPNRHGHAELLRRAERAAARVGHPLHQEPQIGPASRYIGERHRASRGIVTRLDSSDPSDAWWPDSTRRVPESGRISAVPSGRVRGRPCRCLGCESVAKRVSGSTSVARRAGAGRPQSTHRQQRHAVNGSLDVTPTSIPSMSRLRNTAPARPSDRPSASWTSPSLRTIQRTWRA